MGVAFSMGNFTAGKLPLLLGFVAGSFFLVAHIFTLNDWSETYEGPANATAKIDNVHSNRRKLLLLSLSLLCGAMLVFAFLPRPTLVFAVLTASLGIVYSHPLLNGKCIPILCSLLHFCGGLLHFLLGYVLFAPVDRRGVLIAVFFALTFMAGHLNHEVGDFELDQPCGLTTNAVTFGKRNVFLMGLLVFTVAYAWLLILAASEIIPRPLALLPILLYPLHVFWSMRALQDDLSPASLNRLQIRYRVLYAIMGIAMLFVLFGNWFPNRG
jgi:4-hydroxybenzoate polyprenyltransferase